MAEMSDTLELEGQQVEVVEMSIPVATVIYSALQGAELKLMLEVAISWEY